MLKSLKVLPTNRFANSEHYGDILKEYNRQFESSNGKINNKEFFEKIISPLLPEYGLQSWYQYIRRFKTEVGLRYAEDGNKPSLVNGEKEIEEGNLAMNLVGNQEAISKGINAALNLGSAVLQRIAKKFYANPDSLTSAEMKLATECLFKSMKAQDSRIHAIGKIREDNREEEKMERAFEGASYG